jgi:hypothetical protein
MKAADTDERKEDEGRVWDRDEVAGERQRAQGAPVYALNAGRRFLTSEEFLARRRTAPSAGAL